MKKAAAAAALVIALAGCASTVPSDTSSSDTGTQTTNSDTVQTTPDFGTDAYCFAEADSLYTKYPSVYASKQEAYDGCRSAKGLADELNGKINRTP